MTVHEKRDIWFVDSGCSKHMIGNRKAFVELGEKFSFGVEVGDGKLAKFNGEGVIIIHSKEGRIQYINDILYASSLTNNLLSVGWMMKNDYKIIF